LSGESIAAGSDIKIMASDQFHGYKKEKQDDIAVLFIDLGVSSTSFVIFADNSVRFTSSIPISSQALTVAVTEKLGINLDEAEKLKVKYGLTIKEGIKNDDITRAIKPLLMDLASQIKKYISFYQSHSSHDYLSSDNPSYGKIEKIILCGGGANLKGLSKFLMEQIKISVEIGHPFVNIFGNGNCNDIDDQIIINQKMLSFTTALGLALRGVKES